MKQMQTFMWILLPLAGILWWQGQQQPASQTAAPAAIPTARIAVVNTNAFSADNGIQQLVQQRNLLEEKFRPRIEELQKLRQQIDALQQEIRTKSANWTIEVRQSKQDELESTQIKAKRLAEDLDRQTKREQLRVTTPIKERIQTLLEQYAGRRGITMILDVAPLRQVGALPYVNQAIDITQDFIKEYNKAYPALQPTKSKSSQ